MSFQLRKEILLEHSKANAARVKNWIGGDKDRFKQLMQLFLQDEYRIVQRAAWIISLVAQDKRQLIRPYLAEMVDHIQRPGLPVAVKRNVLRILQLEDIPEALEAPVMNICFDLLADVKEPIAVRAFSIRVLANLSKLYPEIKPELKVILEAGLEQNPSAGFKSRALKTLKAL